MSTSLPDSHHSEGRLLVVLRHARAEAFAQDDHARHLTDRGRRDAVETGAWLRAQGVVPDLALVSSASRTQETWALVVEALGEAVADTRTEVSDAVYSASPETVLDLLRELPAHSRVVAYVGHNPTAASLPQLLEDGEGDPLVFARLSAGFAPASVAVLRFAGEWADLGEGSATLVALHAPGDPA